MTLTYWSAPGMKTCFDAKSTIRFICELKGLLPSLVCSKSRKRNLVEARQLIFYFMFDKTKMTKKEMGWNVGHRDHSTVIHNLSAIQDRMDTDPEFALEVKRIEQKII